MVNNGDLLSKFTSKALYEETVREKKALVATLTTKGKETSPIRVLIRSECVYKHDFQTGYVFLITILTISDLCFPLKFEIRNTSLIHECKFELDLTDPNISNEYKYIYYLLKTLSMVEFCLLYRNFKTKRSIDNK